MHADIVQVLFALVVGLYMVSIVAEIPLIFVDAYPAFGIAVLKQSTPRRCFPVRGAFSSASCRSGRFIERLDQSGASQADLSAAPAAHL